MEEIVVSSSPFIHGKNDVNKMFLYISLMLIFPATYGVMNYGSNALIMIVVSVFACAGFEIAFNFFEKHRFLIRDISFIVTGMILAMTLPLKTPIYVIIIADFVAIFVTKLSFGGLGRNYFNPALVARCLVGVMIPDITSTLYTATFAGDEYISLTIGGTNTLSNLFNGYAVGGIGTTCILMILACYVLLADMKIIDLKIPLISAIAYFAVSAYFNGLENAAINLFSGSFLFVSVFMMTDPNTSPNTLLGKLIFSLLFGAISALAWDYGRLGENTVFAVALVVNVLVPFLDNITISRPQTLGGYRNAHKN